jgi:hypothetical protein
MDHVGGGGDDLEAAIAFSIVASGTEDSHVPRYQRSGRSVAADRPPSTWQSAMGVDIVDASS